jgi:hypothetical protein
VLREETAEPGLVLASVAEVGMAGRVAAWAVAARTPTRARAAMVEAAWAVRRGAADWEVEAPAVVWAAAGLGAAYLVESSAAAKEAGVRAVVRR